MRKQRGVSLSGLLIVAFILVFVSLVGFKLTPPYLEYFTIKKLLKEITLNPETKGGGPREIKVAFVRRSSVENITAIGPDDIEISKEGDQLVLSASWSVKVPLVYNISALLDFTAATNE